MKHEIQKPEGAKLKKVVIYTDGACSGNPGMGGWGAVLDYSGRKKEISGFMENTTNNQMELLATIKALEILKEHCEVDIFTDSKYVQHGITVWIKNWIKNNWKTSNKGPVKNVELWQQLLTLTQKHKVSWHWVKGHSGDKNNDIADRLASDEIKKHKKTLEQ
ncbi:MAG TPA: ribonuclease HI [Alphaproteobacteria bacterium]|nr:ribonuclease HI [Alphaproteobacteria bacterium]